MDRIQSAAFQKDRARRQAFHNWEIEYGLDRCIALLRSNVTGHAGDGHAFQHHTITQPPSEVYWHHPLWSAATDMGCDEFGKKTRQPLYPRRVTSTAFQLAVDHAFTGSYAQRFRPSDPHESLTCPCGALLRSLSHLIRECPRLYQPRVNQAIHSHTRTLTLAQLHKSVPRAHQLLRFITEGRVAMRPPELGPTLPVPPEPE
jgi:hypothetical protein